MSASNKDEALRCIGLAKRKWAEGNAHGAVKLLQKSIQMYDTPEAKTLLTQFTASSNQSTDNNNSNNNSNNNNNTNQSEEQKEGLNNNSNNNNNNSNHNSYNSNNNNTPINNNNRFMASSSSSSSSTSSASSSFMSSASNASPSASASSLPSTSPTKKSSRMTKEQEVEIVKRILRTKDYYDLLGVPKTANSEAMKKAYKKIALRLHPDRNKAPGAEEAFKKVATAYQTLTDDRKKQIYDMYGADAPQMRSERAHFEHMTPDDILSAFFGGHPFGGGSSFMFSSHPHFRFHSRRHGHEQEHGETNQGPNLNFLMQLFPIFIMMFSLLLPSLFSSNGRSSSGSSGLFSSYQNSWNNLEGNVYTLDSQYPFDKLRKSNHGVHYYVSRDFDYRYGRSVSRIEDDVETKHLQRLIQSCNEEKKSVSNLKEEITSAKLSNEQRMRLLKKLQDINQVRPSSNKHSSSSSTKNEKKGNKCMKLHEFVELL